MRTYLKYFVYVVRHKLWVLIECWKVGLFWQGITHDLSKFLPSEFFPYARYFYGFKIVAVKTKNDFNRAWGFHQERNPHHWEYWTGQNVDGGATLEMHHKYIKEMIADWRGAGMAIHGKDDSLEFYMKNKKRIILGDLTRRHVERLLGVHEEGEA
ncbi:MAG: DUF5662 family protein [Thermodesulfovibrionales bacterium]|nr:DUF5662 family protein [Thermodesulfovibrionales bacterium]